MATNVATSSQTESPTSVKVYKKILHLKIAVSYRDGDRVFVFHLFYSYTSGEINP